MADRFNQFQGQGYAGIPPGPLSAYLGVQAANRGQDLETLQGAGVVQGLLAKMQAQQRQDQFHAAISALGPNPTEKDVMRVAQEHIIDPKDLLHWLTVKDAANTRATETATQHGILNLLAGRRVAVAERGADYNYGGTTPPIVAPSAQPGSFSLATPPQATPRLGGGGLPPLQIPPQVQAQRDVQAANVQGNLTPSGGGPAIAANTVVPTAPPPPTAAPAPPLSPATPMPGRLPQMPPEIASAPLSVQNKWRLQQTKPVGSMAGTAIPPEHANLHGDAYLATLSPGLATVIKKIAAYDLPVNQVTSMRTGEREAMTERVTQFDPSFDMKEYPVRQKAVTEFRTGGPGSPAGNRVAIGQAINHMGTLDKLNQAMENNDIPMANRIKNLWAQETGKTPPVSAQVARVAVGEELMRVFRQVQGSEAEVNRWIDGFPKQGSPAQQHEALVVGAKLLKGRLDELNNRWNDAMKVTTGYPNIISPQAQASLDQFLGGSAPAKTQGGWSVVR